MEIDIIYQTIGKKITVRNYLEKEMKEKETRVLAVQSNSFIFEKQLDTGIRSWLYIGKAVDWRFTNSSADKYEIDIATKQYKLVYQIVYQHK